ncbi:hypothetical protein M408DRAFT_29423, partial [Serendipita vermifera MAFF 305830]
PITDTNGKGKRKATSPPELEDNSIPEHLIEQVLSTVHTPNLLPLDSPRKEPISQRKRRKVKQESTSPFRIPIPSSSRWSPKLRFPTAFGLPSDFGVKTSSPPISFSPLRTQPSTPTSVPVFHPHRPFRLSPTPTRLPPPKRKSIIYTPEPSGPPSPYEEGKPTRVKVLVIEDPSKPARRESESQFIRSLLSQPRLHNTDDNTLSDHLLPEPPNQASLFYDPSNPFVEETHQPGTTEYQALKDKHSAYKNQLKENKEKILASITDLLEHQLDADHNANARYEMSNPVDYSTYTNCRLYKYQDGKYTTEELAARANFKTPEEINREPHPLTRNIYGQLIVDWPKVPEGWTLEQVNQKDANNKPTDPIFYWREFDPFYTRWGRITDPRLTYDDTDDTEVLALHPVYTHVFYDPITTPITKPVQTGIVLEEETTKEIASTIKNQAPYGRLTHPWVAIPPPESLKGIGKSLRFYALYGRRLSQLNTTEMHAQVTTFLEQSNMFYTDSILPESIAKNWRKAIVTDPAAEFLETEMKILKSMNLGIVKSLKQTGSITNVPKYQAVVEPGTNLEKMEKQIQHYAITIMASRVPEEVPTLKTIRGSRDGGKAYDWEEFHYYALRTTIQCKGREEPPHQTLAVVPYTGDIDNPNPFKSYYDPDNFDAEFEKAGSIAPIEEGAGGDPKDPNKSGGPPPPSPPPPSGNYGGYIDPRNHAIHKHPYISTTPPDPPGFEMKQSEAHVDDKIKQVDLPGWDGHDNTVIEYICDINELASDSYTLWKQLGKKAPGRFTKMAKDWWRSLSPREQKDCKKNWSHLRAAIIEQWFTPQFIVNQNEKAMKMKFRDSSKPNEIPLSFYYRKLRALQFAMPYATDSMLIQEIIKTMPQKWLRYFTTTDLADLKLFREKLQAYRTAMLEDDEESHQISDILSQMSRRSKDSSRNSSSFHGSSRKSGRSSSRSSRSSDYKSANTHKVGFDTRRSKRSRPSSSSQTRSFPPAPFKDKKAEGDKVKTKKGLSPGEKRAKGDTKVRPCRQCTSWNHWDYECPYKDHPQAIKVNLADPEVVQEELEYAQAFLASIQEESTSEREEPEELSNSEEESESHSEESENSSGEED